MKTVFVGQQPSSHRDEGVTLPVRPGSSGDRLIRMMGVTEAAFHANFDSINLDPYFNPDGFEAEYAIPAAKNLAPLLAGRRIILLGRAVADAFEIPRKDYKWCVFFDHPVWTEFHGLFCVIPHPSGQNRLYNTHQLYEDVRNLLHYVWETREGEPEQVFSDYSEE